MSDENKDSKKRDKDILLDYDFDGIKEFDNPTPPWFTYLFYVTIVFSAIYWFHYHVFDAGISQDQEYLNEVAQYEAQKLANAQDSTKTKAIAEVLTSEADLEAGAKIYAANNCAACHGLNGEGNQVGPNLTDEYWIVSNKFADVTNTIKTGRITKGMTPYESILNEQQIAQVSSYILVKLKGTNPPNAKASQGEKFQ
ncbi:MAG TPA: hypothetical protein DCQ31_19585 [Bacteroidales bacterium]|nr:hypothetical protein [Bacteroidales bacterium]